MLNSVSGSLNRIECVLCLRPAPRYFQVSLTREVSHVVIENVFVVRKDIGFAIRCDYLSNIRSVYCDYGHLLTGTSSEYRHQVFFDYCGQYSILLVVCRVKHCNHTFTEGVFSNLSHICSTLVGRNNSASPI